MSSGEEKGHHSCIAPLKALINGSFEPAILVSSEGKLVHMNSAAEGVFEFALREDHQPHVLSIISLELPSLGEAVWSNVIGLLQSNSAPKKMSATCFKKNGDKFQAQLKLSLIDMKEVCHTCSQIVAIHINPNQEEARFDHMTRYMSTLLQMLTSIIETCLDPIFQINEQGIIQMVNEAAVTTFGHSREEFIGANISMICGGGHSEKHDQYLERYLQTGEAHVMGKKREVSGRKKDGSEFPLELGLVEISNETDQERMFVGFVRDMTEIRKKERLSTGIVQASLDPVFGIDERGIVQFVNDAAVEEFGYSHEEFIGESISKIVGKEHAEKHDSYIRAYLETGRAKLMGTRRVIPARRKNGTEFEIELGLSEVLSYDGKGEKIFVGFIRDLTAIKKHQNLASGIVEASLDPVFGIDENGLIQFVNEAACVQFGFSKNEFIGSSINKIVGTVHADKHDSYISNYLKTGNAKLMDTRRVIPARRKDGSEFDIELGLSEIKSYDGNERIFVGFVHAVTYKQQTETDPTPLDLSVEINPIFGINGDGIVKFVNNALSESFGYSTEELIGSNIYKICGEEGSDDDYIQSVLARGKRRVMGTKTFVQARRKDGSEFPIEIGLAEVKSYGPEDARMFVGFIRPITQNPK
jgi:PAS domain S-box-containing protein